MSKTSIRKIMHARKVWIRAAIRRMRSRCRLEGAPWRGRRSERERAGRDMKHGNCARRQNRFACRTGVKHSVAKLNARNRNPILQGWDALAAKVKIDRLKLIELRGTRQKKPGAAECTVSEFIAAGRSGKNACRASAAENLPSSQLFVISAGLRPSRCHCPVPDDDHL